MNAETRGPGHRLTERYTLIRVVGRGGMATVWEAVNAAGQRVALKLLHDTLAQNQENVARFFLEARNATRIAHPGIVRVLDTAQTDDGTPFLVMEYLEGVSLETFLERNGPLDAQQTVSVLVPMLDALAAAHAAGVIHRDLKPGNVFIALGKSPSVKLLDFGISRAITNETRLTQTGMLFGTPAYMSPEQIEGTKDAGPPADLYATGAIAFELVTGAPPYTAASALALAAMVVAKPPPALASVKPGLQPAFAAAIDASLRRDVNERPADAMAFKRALVAAVTPDLQWPFERAAQLLEQKPRDDVEPHRLRRVPQPTPPIGAEVTLAVLAERLRTTERTLPPALAVRILCDLLLDPETPPSFGLSHIRVASNGAVRAVAGVPKRLRFAASVQSTLAPEAWDGKPGALSSQFSAAAVLTQLLTGVAPFEAADEATLEQKLRAGAPDLAALPASLRATVQRMLAADPLHRFPDAGSCANELAAPFKSAPLFSRAHEELAALLRATSQVQPPAPEVPSARATPPETRRVGPLLALLVVIAVGIVVWRTRGPSQVLVQREDGTLELMNVDAFDASAPVAQTVVTSSEYAVQTSPPGAALWLDGQFRGNAPGTLALEGNGKATLHLELPAHVPLDVPLVPDGKPHPLTLRLTRAPDVTLAFATFEVLDDDVLWLDDVLVARGPIRLPVEAGKTHRWEVERGGTRLEGRGFSLSTGEEKTLDAPR
ncbi:MAG: protein kinase [Archangium sp.]